jgi:hypothetical protein
VHHQHARALVLNGGVVGEITLEHRAARLVRHFLAFDGGV